MDQLPQTDRIWSCDDRARWLRAAVSILLDLVYKVGDDAAIGSQSLRSPSRTARAPPSRR